MYRQGHMITSRYQGKKSCYLIGSMEWIGTFVREQAFFGLGTDRRERDWSV